MQFSRSVENQDMQEIYGDLLGSAAGGQNRHHAPPVQVNMGRTAMQRMDLSGDSAEQMVENTITGMEDLGASLRNNERLIYVIGQTRRMFEGISFFEETS